MISAATIISSARRRSPLRNTMTAPTNSAIAPSMTIESSVSPMPDEAAVKNGVEKVIEITLMPEEKAAFDKSVAAVRELVKALPL